MRHNPLPNKDPSSWIPRGVTAGYIALLASLPLGGALTPAPALALSEGRTYELVSPVYKAGYGVNAILGVAPDGESVVFNSLGSFAGNPLGISVGNEYVARRGGSGWSTAPLQVPAARQPYSYVRDFSATLDRALTEGKPAPNEGAGFYQGNEFEFLLHDMTSPDEAAYFQLAGEVLTPLKQVTEFVTNYQGANPDLSLIVFSVPLLTRTYLLPEAKNTLSVLYSMVSAGGAESLRLVGLNNKRKALSPTCEPELGTASGGGSQYNSVSRDGEEIFFSLGVSGVSVVGCLEHQQLFMRVGGARTVEVSKPVSAVCGEVPCVGAEGRAPAEFVGASEDGSKVFFTAPLAAGQPPLVPGDTDTSNNLYMAEIGCPGGGETCEAAQRGVTALVQVSHGAEPAEVQGVVNVAPDGSRVYFVARGALSGGANAEGASAVKGADNLYVYDSRTGGAPVFIADLCSGPEESGVARDPRCPAALAQGKSSRNDMDLWTQTVREAQVNDCTEAVAGCETGRFFLFSTYGRLTADDTDAAKDVYRYDAQTGTLERVSVGEDGSDANGNADQFDATIERAGVRHTLFEEHDLNSRAITQDGSRVVFRSGEPLSLAARSGVENAYEWHESGVSLVSSGSSAVEQVVISSSGRDVFFTTTEGLVPQDTDGQSDLYDARVGGGFPSAPSEPEPCSGDACQGPLTNPAPLLVPGSVSQAPGGNLAPPTPTTTTTKAKKTVRCSKGRKLSHGRCVRTKSKRAKAKRAGVKRRAGS